MKRVFVVFILLVLQCYSVFGVRSSRIKHIVVLMMENRSFDHLLGFLKVDRNKDIDGLTGNESIPRDPNDLSKGEVPVTRNGYDVSPDDPNHTFEDITIQVNNNNMNGFVYNSLQTGLNETNPVNMFDSNSAPIINTLASEFAVFDSWFCSLPSSTDPNRAFALSGTSTGVVTNYNGTQWQQESYFNYLHSRDRSVAGYFQDDVWVFGYFADMRQAEIAKKIRGLDAHFYDDVKHGKLADFTYLQPRMSTLSEDILPTWQHPDASVLEGEKLIKSVYEALRNGPQWEETLLLVTYDEHGGFADHVSPPFENVPAPDDNVASNGFAFDRLGVRIPTIAISPWVPKGLVIHDAFPKEQPTPSSAFESTSVMATANILLGLHDAPPMGKRMAWANTFAGLFDLLSEPRQDCPEKLPDLPKEVNPLATFEAQRAKPLNDHLVHQLLFYCVEHYPVEHAKGECPGRREVMFNQGLASDWLAQQSKVFRRTVFFDQDV
jgi:phospholipase C